MQLDSFDFEFALVQQIVGMRGFSQVSAGRHFQPHIQERGVNDLSAHADNIDAGSIERGNIRKRNTPAESKFDLPVLVCGLPLLQNRLDILNDQGGVVDMARIDIYDISAGMDCCPCLPDQVAAFISAANLDHPPTLLHLESGA